MSGWTGASGVLVCRVVFRLTPKATSVSIVPMKNDAAKVNVTPELLAAEAARLARYEAQVAAAREADMAEEGLDTGAAYLDAITAMEFQRRWLEHLSRKAKALGITA